LQATGVGWTEGAGDEERREQVQEWRRRRTNEKKLEEMKLLKIGRGRAGEAEGPSLCLIFSRLSVWNRHCRMIC
jgi:hypothetical protein